MSKEHDHLHEEDIDCTIAIEQFYAYLDNELNNERDVIKFEQHIDHCKSCLSRLQLEQALSKRLSRDPHEGIPGSLRDRLKHIVDNL